MMLAEMQEKKTAEEAAELALQIAKGGGADAVAMALAHGCSLQMVWLCGRSDLMLKYRGCYYCINDEFPHIQEGVRELTGLRFPWLRRWSSWTRYINVTWYHAG